jgi:hypothetical protein
MSAETVRQAMADLGRIGASIQAKAAAAIAYEGQHRTRTGASLTLNAARRNHAAGNTHALRYFDIEEITGAREPADIQDIRARVLDALMDER